MKVRRVITACDATGKSVLHAVDFAHRTHDYRHIPGMSNTQVWATPPLPLLSNPPADQTATMRSVVPPHGGTRFMLVQFPPDSVMKNPRFDASAADAENREVLPGLAEHFEPDGMHATETIDYGILLEGELWLELDDGRTQQLRKHDVVIQNGTRHAWRNRSDGVALMAFVLIGAKRAT